MSQWRWGSFAQFPSKKEPAQSSRELRNESSGVLLLAPFSRLRIQGFMVSLARNFVPLVHQMMMGHDLSVPGTTLDEKTAVSACITVRGGR